MPSTFSPLKIQLMATGENNTTWGDVTNLNLGTALEEAIVGSADVTFASADVTLTLTDTNASQTARNMRLRCTGTTGGSTRNLVVPSIEKPYIVRNDCADSVVVKTAAGTGITIPTGRTMWVYSDATNVVDAVTHLSSLTLGTSLPVSSGGTGTNTAFTAGSVVFAGASGVYTQDNANLFWDDTNDRLGIGTATPSFRLQVQTDTDANAGAFIRNSNTGTAAAGILTVASPVGNISIRAHSAANSAWPNSTLIISDSGFTGGLNLFQNGANPIRLWTNGSERMRIDSSGNVGIGTTTPTAKVQIGTVTTSFGASEVNLALTGANGFFNSSLLFASENTNFRYQNKFLVDTGALTWQNSTDGTNYTERMRIDTSGNVGIGTSSPLFKFVVSNAGGAGLEIDPTALASSPLIQSYNRSGAAYTQLGFDALQYVWRTSGSERMRIDSSGNVVVGATSGNGRLTVRGAGTTGSTYSFEAANSGGSTRFIVADNGQSDFYNSSNALSMRIDSSGNVGIGVVPVAGYGRSIQLRQDALAATSALLTQAINVNDQRLTLVNNALPPAGGFTGTYQYTYTGASATRYEQGGGFHTWFTAPTGTAGNTITFTQAMTLDNSGNFLLGKTAANFDATGVEYLASTKILRSTTSSNAALQLQRTTTDGDVIQFWNAGSLNSSISVVGSNAFLGATGLLGFSAGGGERMRISSDGNIMVNTTTVLNGSIFTINAGGTWGLGIVSTLSGGVNYFAQFFNGASGVGSITANGTNTAYNTSSDYRLKDVDGPVTNSGAYIDALKPVQGSWKADGSRFIGLLAHEVQEVSETTIATGEKDGEKMQAMDYSAPELIANLIAEIQSLRARVAQLEGN